MPKIRDGALTPKQRAFVEIFVKENGRLTATDCAKQAGYSSDHSLLQRFLQKLFVLVSMHHL